MGKAWMKLRNRSQKAWLLAWALVLGLPYTLATNGTGAANSTGVSTITRAICNIYTNYLSNKGLIFAIVLVVVAWAGYMIYMGKREATDVIIKAVIATAIIVGAKELAEAVVSGGCPTT